MIDAARESFPDFRRYLRAKARALGVEQAAWYDLFAPVGAEQQRWEYAQAERFIVEQFGTYSPRLSQFAARAFDEHWIDAEPRPGKRDGAFCMGLRGDESRMCINYQPALRRREHAGARAGPRLPQPDPRGAHEPATRHPMTLAETASIFCETIVRHAALRVRRAQRSRSRSSRRRCRAPAKLSSISPAASCSSSASSRAASGASCRSTSCAH